MAIKNSSNEGLAFENTLWDTANQLRGHMDAAEYKHVVLGLIFLKYITDTFNEYYNKLETWTADPAHDYYVKEPSVRYEVLEDRDEYAAENVFWVPQNARRFHLQANAKRSEIGQIIDQAMETIEKENPNLKGVLPKDNALLAQSKSDVSRGETNSKKPSSKDDKDISVASPGSRPSPPRTSTIEPISSGQPAIPQVQLPNLYIASEGPFSQRLKRVQNLSKNPSPAEIAELTICLAAPESSLRWLASATLSKIGGPQVEAAAKALLEKDISDEAREEALKLLGQIS